MDSSIAPGPSKFTAINSSSRHLRSADIPLFSSAERRTETSPSDELETSTATLSSSLPSSSPGRESQKDPELDRQLDRTAETHVPILPKPVQHHHIRPQTRSQFQPFIDTSLPLILPVYRFGCGPYIGKTIDDVPFEYLCHLARGGEYAIGWIDGVLREWLVRKGFCMEERLIENTWNGEGVESGRWDRVEVVPFGVERVSPLGATVTVEVGDGGRGGSEGRSEGGSGSRRRQREWCTPQESRLRGEKIGNEEVVGVPRAPKYARMRAGGAHFRDV